MAKTLVIAEKPSLGRSIASGLTWWKKEQFTRQGKDRNTWLESQNYIVASSVGHLYELIDLDAYFPDYEPGKKRSWTMDRLPFFPDDWNFKFEGKDNVKGLIRTINSLMNRADVDRIYNAGDLTGKGSGSLMKLSSMGSKSRNPSTGSGCPIRPTRPSNRHLRRQNLMMGMRIFPPPQRPAARWTGSWELN